MVPPIASSARNEIAPSAVLAPRALGREAQRVVFQRLVGNPLIILAPDAVYPLPPCHVAQLPPKRCTGNPVRKDRARTYVAILRCNIRDLAYLCTAQFQQSLLNQEACQRTKWGAHVRRCQTGPEVSASAQVADGNGGIAGHYDASAAVIR